MMDEAETEKIRAFHDFDKRVVAVWRDEDRTLFICDKEITIKLWLGFQSCKERAKPEVN